MVDLVVFQPSTPTYEIGEAGAYIQNKILYPACYHVATHGITHGSGRATGGVSKLILPPFRECGISKYAAKTHLLRRVSYNPGSIKFDNTHELLVTIHLDLPKMLLVRKISSVASWP